MNLKRNKKGFTLVELIVVLVIIGILMALVIPNLTGYIDKAQNKNIEVNARAAYMAAMALTAEGYAKKPATTPTATEIKALAKLTSDTQVVGDLEIANGTVTKLSYTEDGKKIIYTNGVPGEITTVTP